MPKTRRARPRTVVAVAQLYSLGLSDRQLRRRVAAGWLHRLHRGVCAVGHRNITREGWWMAAVLACGEGAVLSHQAAGELWKIRQPRGRPSGAGSAEGTGLGLALTRRFVEMHGGSIAAASVYGKGSTFTV